MNSDFVSFYLCIRECNAFKIMNTMYITLHFIGYISGPKANKDPTLNYALGIFLRSFTLSDGICTARISMHCVFKQTAQQLPLF